jgi:hypothetical protein
LTARTTASRHIAAYVAQYIHELSERHEKDRETLTAVVGPGAGVPQTA